MAIVAIFREPLLQGFHLVGQATHLVLQLLEQRVLLVHHGFQLMDAFLALRQLRSQALLLFSQRSQFFFNRHALTLPGLTHFGKPLADLGSYSNAFINMNKLVRGW